MKLFSLTLFAATSLLLSAESTRPNILFFFSDDHATRAISSYPGGDLDDIAPTANIDRIAKEGLLFTNSFCANSICGPSRASILTGKHSHLNGFLDNNSSRFDGYQQTFPQLLGKTGYQSAMIGKWHLHSHPVGFDFWRILPGQGAYYNPDFIEMDGSTKQYQGHCNDKVTDFALEWLEKSRDSNKPFVLMTQFKAPHRNWAPALRHLELFKDLTIPEPDSLFDDYANRSSVLGEHAMGIADHMYWGHDMKFEGENLFPDHFLSGLPNNAIKRMNETQRKQWRAVYEPQNQQFIADLNAGKLTEEDIVRWKYQRYMKDYLGSIRSMDEGIGRILDYLKETGLEKNTIVIYSSDQGFYLGEHGWYDKRWMFEESLEMPFIIRWPGKIKPGSISDALIQNIDYAPTFLEICGAEIPPDIQGRSLVPLLKNSGQAPDDWRTAIYYAYYGERTHNVAAHDGIRTEDFTAFYVPKTEEWQLFDLKKDPTQMTSVHEDPEYADTLANLQQEYTGLKKQYRAHSAVLPQHRNEKKKWAERHREKNELALENSYDLLFIGDSITKGWEGAGKKSWEKYYAHRNALNLGFSGDRTEHVIWRLNNGNLRKQQKAKVAVVLIGTNNTGHHQQDPYETAEGVSRILSTLRARCPEAKVLLMGTFPRAKEPTHQDRLLNVSINRLLSKMADGERVHYLDISDQFIAHDGTLPKEIMPDSLHLNTKGYRLWAEAIEPKLKELGL